MKPTLSRSCALLPLLLAAGCAAARPDGGPGEAAGLAIVGVTVVDVTGAPPRPGTTVLVAGGRITAVGSSTEVRVPAGARRVDGTGKFLIPGLWDAHAHLAMSGEGSLPVYVAAGVTSVRDPGGAYAVVDGWRRAILRGERLGPRIRTAGSILESGAFLDRVATVDRMLAERYGIPAPGAWSASSPRTRVESPRDARRAVDSLAALGVDLVKARSFESRETFFAVAEAAREARLPLAIHYPYGGISLAQVSDAIGAGSLEHAFHYAAALDSLAAGERAAVHARLRGNGTWVAPTLATERMRTLPDSTVERMLAELLGGRDARGRTLTPTLRGIWSRDMRIRLEEHRLQPPAGAEEEFRSSVRLLREMHSAGCGCSPGPTWGRC